MAICVELDKTLEGMEMQGDESHSYLDRHSGEISLISGEELRAAEDDDSLDDYPEWQHENIKIARKIICDKDENLLELPTKFDINEYRMMERFCLSVENEQISEELDRAIRGRGAFRGFKDRIYQHELQDDWFKFRDEALKEIAIDWCETNNITYIDKEEK